MAVTIKEAVSKSDLKAFVNFQFKLYKGDEFWVPPLKSSELKSLLPEVNPSFEFCDAKFWLAYKDGKVVGRIGGIINHRYIEKTGEKLARFSRLEFIDDREVVAELLAVAEKWARDNGMDGIDGPLGFTNLDHQAMLIEGHDYLPSIASEYHKAYYKEHMEALGYDKEMDWIEFRIKVPEEIHPKAQRVADIIQKRGGFTVRSFEKTSELKQFGHELFRLLDTAFKDLFSFVPFNERMIDFYVEKYLPLLNPKFVKVIFDKENAIAGFIISLPSLSKAMQKAKGSLYPFGFVHILKAFKNPDTLDLMLTGVDPKYQSLGLPAFLIVELQKTAHAAGITDVETTGMIETNQKAIGMWKEFDHIQHKRKRCFIKRF